MKKWIASACLVGMILASASLAVAPPARPLQVSEVERLVAQMGDRNYALRDQAERRLRAEGLAALPFLRKAVGHKDPEIRRRAFRILPGLEHARLVAPRRVSMTVRNQPISAILAELSKQTGYKVLLTDNNGPVFAVAGLPGAPAAARPAGKPSRCYTYTFLNTPFWDVIERLCRDTNMVVSQSWGDDSVRLMPSTGYAAHAGRDGAFRYTASSFQLARQIDLSTTSSAMSAENRVDNLTFAFQVFCEPRLPFMGTGEVRLDAAYDSERNSMLVPANDARELEMQNARWGGMRINRRYYGGVSKQLNVHASFSLQRVSQKATTMKVLRGVLPVTLLVEQRPTVAFDKVLTAKGKKKLVGNIEFSIESVEKKANNQVQIKFVATHKGPMNDFNWMNNLFQRIEVQDAKGAKFQVNSQNWLGANGTSVTMMVGYSPGDPKSGPAERFVFHEWVTCQHDIHFEFRDIPLP